METDVDNSLAHETNLNDSLSLSSGSTFFNETQKTGQCNDVICESTTDIQEDQLNSSNIFEAPNTFLDTSGSPTESSSITLNEVESSTDSLVENCKNDLSKNISENVDDLVQREVDTDTTVCRNHICVDAKSKLEKMIEYLNTQNAIFQQDNNDLKTEIKRQEVLFKKTESLIRAEFFSNIEKLSKECNTLRKEKEAMVIRYANSEKEVIQEKKVQQELEKKLKDLHKDRENLLSRIKTLNLDIAKLSSNNDSKMVEVAKLQKDLERMSSDHHSKEIRIKWLQNKLIAETTSHQETQTKLDSTTHRLNEMKEEAEQVRKDCQEMIKCYQEAEEIKSVKLDSQLKKKVTELEVNKQEIDDQHQVYQLLRHELEALKKQQRSTMEENNSLTLKIQVLEKERLEYEQNTSKLKDIQNTSQQEIADLTARLAEMESLQVQLEREKDKVSASSREVERLRLTNAELQADMNACHQKEGELLKFTEGVTETNVKLQSVHSLLEVKSQALENEIAELKVLYSELVEKNSILVSELGKFREQHEEETQLLARKLAEKTKIVEKLNVRLDEAENENRILKRRHVASTKEMSRELLECRKKLDFYESTNGIRTESLTVDSRSSSSASLDVQSNENRRNAQSPVISSVLTLNKKETSDSEIPVEFPEIDKEMLIERIIKLQKILAKKNDKIDLLEDHIVELVKEMRKKPKSVNFKPV